MENKKTLVIGGSENPARYSNKAIRMLREYNIETLAIAKRSGKVLDVAIRTEFPENNSFNIVTLYIGAKHQPEYYNQLLVLKPERVIFNPGTENEELAEMLKNNGIEVVEACTLVMLRTGQY